MNSDFDEPNRRYPFIVVVLSYAVQIITITGLFLANHQYGYWAFYFGVILYFLLVCSLWLHISYPEKKVAPIVFNVIFIPYFLWQFFSIMMTVPYLIYFLLYIGFLMMALPYIAVLNVLINALSLFIFALVCYGLFFFPKKLKIKKIKLKHPKENVKNYKIVHLSDIHIGNFISRKYKEKITKEVSDCKPDLIVITGDLLTFGDYFIDDAVAFIATLKARDGIIFSLGNHEYYVDTARLLDKLNEIGCIVLCTEVYSNQILTVGAVSGITNNISASMRELSEIITKNKNMIPDILLAHDPIIFYKSYTKKIPLTLSGHTHGGQIKLSLLNRLVSHFEKNEYISGLYQRENSYLYVHQGLGMSGLPFRLGVSPEVVLFIFV